MKTTKQLKGLYYVALFGGNCTLRRGPPSAIRRALGTENVVAIRPATEKDIAWVVGMGGTVP